MRSGRPLIQITGFLNSYTSYGILTQRFAQHLLSSDNGVVVRPIHFQEPWGDPTKVSDDVKSLIVYKDLKAVDHELVFHTPNCNHRLLKKSGLAKKHRTLYTLWESSLVNPKHIKNIHRYYGQVIVPNQFCRDVLLKSGLELPCFIAPLGGDTGDFYPDEQKFPSDEVFTFLSAGRLAHGGVRKGVQEVIAIFKEAFPDNPNVNLRVKLHPDCPDFPEFDCRVNTIRNFMDKKSLLQWYRSGNAYVTIGAEGWGWHQQEAQLCGLPLVGVNWGGLTNFFHGEEAKYTLKTARDSEIYENTGKQPIVNRKDLIEKMRLMASRPAHTHRVGLGGISKALEWSWERSRTEFLTTVNNILGL